MPSFTGANLYNGIFHFIFFAVYAAMVRKSLKGKDLNTDRVDLMLFSPLSQAASRIGGIASFVAALLMTVFFAYFVLYNPALLRFDTQVLLYVFLECLVIASLLVSGIAMMQRWFYAPALYLISVASILTSTLFAIIYFGTDAQPLPIDIVGVSLSTLLIVVFGIVYTAQYLELSAKVPLPFRRRIV